MPTKKKATREPIVLQGQKIARSWWGQAWNANLEAYSDYANRLPRARTYVRTGKVIDLKILPGRVEGLVQGTRKTPYKVLIHIDPLDPNHLQHIETLVGARVENLEALIQGRFPQALGKIFTDYNHGLFPKPKEIAFTCSCPDWATMCKHVGAVLYGIGARLDTNPLLFFTLRDIDMKIFLQKTIDQRLEDMLRRAESPSKRVLSPDDAQDLFHL